MKLNIWLAKHAVETAEDQSRGYTNRYPLNKWWIKPDDDCGSFMSEMLHDALLMIGIDIGQQYFEPMGDNGIYNEELLLKYCNRFDYANEKDKIGDILVSYGHTEMVTNLDPKQLTGARDDYDGKPGDYTTGREISTSPFFNASNGGWKYIYRLKDEYNRELDEEEEIKMIMVELPELKKGCRGYAVKSLQSLLNLWTTQSGENRPIVCDGEFGDETEERVKFYQHIQKLPVDGVCGKLTWADLIN